MMPLASLSRDPLQMLKVDVIGYGAKDTGEMGGGAAASILAAAGPEVLPAAKLKLAKTSRRVGDVVITDAFNLQSLGIRWIVHIISIIKHTPEGPYCPEPERLRDGITSALFEVSRLGVRSIAISALGTGEGRVEPHLAARHMFGGVRAFRENEPTSKLTITFSLPSFRDYESFSAVMSESR